MDKHQWNYNTGSPRIRWAQLRLTLALHFVCDGNWVIYCQQMLIFVLIFRQFWNCVVRSSQNGCFLSHRHCSKKDKRHMFLWHHLNHFFPNVETLFSLLFFSVFCCLFVGSTKDNFVGRVRKNKTDDKLEFLVHKVEGETLFHYKKSATETNRRPKELSVSVESDVKNGDMEQFVEEVSNMLLLNHPNILSVLGMSSHGGKLCLICPLMRNKDLRQYLLQNRTVSIAWRTVKYFIL